MNFWGKVIAAAAVVPDDCCFSLPEKDNSVFLYVTLVSRLGIITCLMMNNARIAHIECNNVRSRKSGKRLSRFRSRRLLKLENENKIKSYTVDQRSNEEKKSRRKRPNTSYSWH